MWDKAPVILDAVGFVLIAAGVWFLFGWWALIVAGVLLVLAGYRAQS